VIELEIQKPREARRFLLASIPDDRFLHVHDLHDPREIWRELNLEVNVRNDDRFVKLTQNFYEEEFRAGDTLQSFARRLEFIYTHLAPTKHALDN
jgi:hypothetical protein